VSVCVKSMKEDVHERERECVCVRKGREDVCERERGRGVRLCVCSGDMKYIGTEICHPTNTDTVMITILITHTHIHITMNTYNTHT
jgi:phosphoserine phosphatase